MTGPDRHEAGKPPTTTGGGRVGRYELLGLLGIVAVALGLRLVGLRYGLPEPLLNPDEANIVPRAWALVHGGGLDPGWYDYPSLMMLVLGPTQVLAADPSIGAARIVALLIGTLGVVAVWWLGRVAYGTRAALVGAAAVAVATTHVAYSRMAVTDILLTLLVTTTLALLVMGRIEWAGIAAGLAVSAKYPGIVLAVPIVVASWRTWRRGLSALGLAAVSFAVTSPFVLIHAGRAWDDVTRVQELARLGWLGFEDDPVTPIAFIDRLWGGFGPFLVVAVVALVAAVRRRSRADLLLLTFVAAYWVQLMPIDAHFDRYILPLVPVLAVLAGSVRLLVPVALVSLVVPLLWSADGARGLRGDDTRLAAQHWVEQHVAAGERIAADPSTASMRSNDVLGLELPGPGRPFDPQRDLDGLRVAGVRWIVTTGAVVDRLAAHPDLYPRELAFYADLERRARLVFEADDDDAGRTGPWVRVYRLDEARTR